MNPRLHTLTIEKNAAGEWIWLLVASNGGRATEGYKRPRSCVANLQAVTAIEARFDTVPSRSPTWVCEVNLGERRTRYVTVKAAA